MTYSILQKYVDEGSRSSRSWSFSVLLEDVSPFILEASSVLTNWRGVAGF